MKNSNPHEPPNCSNCQFIVDIHFQKDITHVWTKNFSGDVFHYELLYHPKIYVMADEVVTQYTSKADRSLDQIQRELQTLDGIIKIRQVLRYPTSSSEIYAPALELTLYSPKVMTELVEFLKIQRYNLFNYDVNKRQQFFIDTKSFPFGACHIVTSIPEVEELAFLNYSLPDNAVELDAIQMYDDPNDVDFDLPPLRVISLELDIAKNGAFERDDDVLRGVTVTQRTFLEDAEEPVKFEGHEMKVLLDLINHIKKLDPDFLIIPYGDKFALNYLAYRASVHGMTQSFYLGRLPIPHFPRKKQKPQIYMTYGQIMHKEPVTYLPGRIHLDYENSFLLYEAEIFGLITLCRLSATPAERTARASIGTVLTGIEYLVNTKTVPETLIPPNKAIGEIFKPSEMLLIADNGGLTYPAIPGVYDRVWAIDYTSLYPFIMAKHNIGNETVLCPHDDCKGKNIVPEVNYHVCTKRIGVVPRTLSLVLEKRVRLKAAKKVKTSKQALYKGVDAALKWILVCCLDGSTRVQIRKNGVQYNQRLDTVVNEFSHEDNLEALGMDEFGQPEFKPVKNVIKVKPKTSVYKIRFRGGTSVVATADHLWPVITENGWRNVRTDQLTLENWIPQLEKFDSIHNKNEVDIVDELLNVITSQELRKWRIFGCDLEEILSKEFEKIRNVAEADYTIQAIHQWSKKGMLPIKYWPSIRSDYKDAEFFVGRGKKKGGQIQWINSRIPLDHDFGFFLGYLLGDGSIGNTVRLAVGSEDQDIIDELCSLVPRIWNIKPKIYDEKNARMVNVQINSRAISFVLERIFGITGRAIERTLSIPNIVWNAPIELAKGFLLGLFAADGSVGTDRLNIRFTTAQRSFAEEIGMLCTRVGLVYRLYTYSQLSYVELRDDRYVRKFQEFGFISKKHTKRITELRGLSKYQRHSEWPSTSSGLLNLSKKTRKTRNPRITKRDSISKSVFKKKIQQINSASHKLSDQDKAHLKWLENIVQQPVIFSKVVEITRLEEPPEYVYCLELDSINPWFMIQGSLITHNCFGYLGFKNARWGSIESHQCVTAYGRRYLLIARQICEKYGFEIIAGLTDSLFIRAIDKKNDTQDMINRIIYEISFETGIPMDLEGKFQWVVFCNVKDYYEVAALNRYFGYFNHDEFKLRGIKSRQRSVTVLETEFQKEVLEHLKPAKSVKEFKFLIPSAAKILYKWQRKLKEKQVDARDLILSIQSHVGVENYQSRTQQALVAQTYMTEGNVIQPGQKIRYIVRDDRRRDTLRITIGPLVTKDSEYDAEWYCKLLEKAFLELTEAPQVQFYDRIKYSNTSVIKTLDEWFEPELLSG